MRTELQIDILNSLGEHDLLDWKDLVLSAVDAPELYSQCTCFGCVANAVAVTWGDEARRAYMCAIFDDYE